MAAIPVNPFYWSKSAKHDVPLTSLTADLLWPGSYFFFYTRCGIVARRGMASFKAKFPVFQELFAKNHRGAKAPPSGARVKGRSHIKERSSEVMLWRHRVALRFFRITFDRNELETWGWCSSSQCSSRQGASTDMQYDLLRSHCDLGLAWLMSDFKIDLSRTEKNIWIDPARREENDGAKLFPELK